MGRLTDDLLDAGRAIMGKIVLERQPLDLAAVVGRSLGTLQAAGRLDRHRVEQDLAPVWVNGDATRIEQIVANLVGNALKFTAEGGTILVTVGAHAGQAILRVRDSGIGMSPELAAKVFELFVQGDSALDRTQGGLGIGLTLVRRLAELHGGYAIAESAGRGRGSEFSVHLPAVEAPARPVAAPAAQAVAPTRDIVIVEDNQDAADTLRRLLELYGHRVRVERDGMAGLEALSAQPPDVALIDIGLPGLDGYELVRRLRGALNGRPAPLLVAVTGYGLPEDRERALAAGFDDHLAKPVDLHALERVLEKAAPSAPGRR